MREYRCTTKCYFHEAIVPAGAIVLCDEAEMKDNPCFEEVKKSTGKKTASAQKTTAESLSEISRIFHERDRQK